MTAWLTMPDFIDGQNVDEGDLDPLVSNINGLRNSTRLLRGKWIQKAGNIATGLGDPETNIPDMSLDNVSTINGQYYAFIYNIYLNCTGPSNSWFIRVRQGTALTGAVVISTMYVSVSAGVDDSKCFVLPWKATSTQTNSYYLSTDRLVGSGTLSIRGDGQSACAVMRAGDDAAGIWTTVT